MHLKKKEKNLKPNYWETETMYNKWLNKIG